MDQARRRRCAPRRPQPRRWAAPTGPPTTICSPSVSTWARLRAPRSTPGRAPPAARIASTTRAPERSTAMPGRRTLPATSTTTFEAGADGPLPSAAASDRGGRPLRPRQRLRPASATATGAPTSWPPLRTRNQQVTTSPTTATTATTASCPGPRPTRPRSGVGHQPDPSARRRQASGATRGGRASAPPAARGGGSTSRRVDLGLGVGHRADPGVAGRDPGVGPLGGVVADGRELAGQELEPPGDGGVVVGGEGSAAHVDDARTAVRPALAPATGGCGEAWTTRVVGEGGRAGQPSRGRDAGRHHAGSDVRTEHRAELAAPDLAAVEVGGEAVAEPAGQVGRPVGVGQVGDADVDVEVARRLDDQVLQPAQGACGGAHALEVGDPPVLDPQQRLDRERSAEQRGGGTDPSATTEVLQRVDVEQRRSPGRPARARPAAASSTEPPASRTSDGAEGGVPGGDPDLSRVDHGDRHRRVPRGEQGRLVRAAHVARQVDRQHRVGARRPLPSRRPRAARPARAARC